MTQPASRSRGEVSTYLVLTFALSAPWYYLIAARANLEQSGGYVFALMWSPAVAALVTNLRLHRSLRGLGWRLPAPRWLLLGYLAPLAYATVAYGAVWLPGLGGLNLANAPEKGIAFVVLGSLVSLAMATGEEIGWRGFLVPALARSMSLTPLAIVSGLIWAAWHLPLVIFADYNAATPLWYAVPCFTASVVCLSFLLAWLRLRANSFWPGALLHASHNLYVQGFFDRVTIDTGHTRWLTGEFGLALTVILLLSAVLLARAPRPWASPDPAVVP